MLECHEGKLWISLVKTHKVQREKRQVGEKEEKEKKSVGGR